MTIWINKGFKQDFQCPACGNVQSGWFEGKDLRFKQGEETKVICLSCQGAFSSGDVEVVPRAFQAVVPQVFIRGDANDIPEGERLRDPRRPAGQSGWEAEREHMKHIERLREGKPGKDVREYGYMSHSIPNELYWSKKRQDPNYWNEKKHWDRHREFAV